MAQSTMKVNDADISGGSHRELAAGVLKQAAQDLRRFHSAKSTVERKLYLDAYSWVVSDDYSWLFFSMAPMIRAPLRQAHPEPNVISNEQNQTMEMTP